MDFCKHCENFYRVQNNTEFGVCILKERYVGYKTGVCDDFKKGLNKTEKARADKEVNKG